MDLPQPSPPVAPTTTTTLTPEQILLTTTITTQTTPATTTSSSSSSSSSSPTTTTTTPTTTTTQKTSTSNNNNNYNNNNNNNDSKSVKLNSVWNSGVASVMNAEWDPNADDFGAKPNAAAVSRIKRDITELFKSPAPGICVLPDDNDITKVHALVTGPMDTPYEGGFFYFLLRCPADYPTSPPRAKLITTGRGQTRFNPNLYKNGKVCLSIIGTWPGPGWSPVLSLGLVLISIQSLMNDHPYFNEPGFERNQDMVVADQYDNFVRHETMRIAVCDVLDGLEPLLDPFRELVEASFVEFVPFYEAQCKKFAHLNGQIMFDPFDKHGRKFDFAAIYERLQKIKARIGI